MRRILLLALPVFVLLAAPAAARAAEGPPTVIVISMDGTPPQAAHSPDLPNLAALAQRGATAEQLVPVFPTNTFPNHVTLATGVRPARHGIVNNVFVDSKRGRFDKSNDPMWIDVEPIWSIADRHGVPSASFYWVGSEGPWRNGHGARHWKKFSSRTGEAVKVQQILAWLDLPDPEQRPRLITCWFRGGDRAGHLHGPDSRQVGRALAEQDQALGRLVAGLNERGVFASTTLLLVSDHGMADVERRVDLGRALRRRGVEARVLGAGGFAIVTVGEAEGSVAGAVEIARELGLEAWPRPEAPPELGLDNERFGDVVVLAPPGSAITSGGLSLPLRGSHGYRPGAPRMGALFVAVGRGAAAGTRLGEVRAVDVAPTVLALLGIQPPAWMEGEPIASLVPAERVGATP